MASLPKTTPITRVCCRHIELATGCSPTKIIWGGPTTDSFGKENPILGPREPLDCLKDGGDCKIQVVYSYSGTKFVQVLGWYPFITVTQVSVHIVIICLESSTGTNRTILEPSKSTVLTPHSKSIPTDPPGFSAATASVPFPISFPAGLRGYWRTRLESPPGQPATAGTNMTSFLLQIFLVCCLNTEVS